nr:hypothetical protein [Gynuella sunshinyii]
MVEIEYQKRWADYDEKFYSYTWFEALANAINGEMQKSTDPIKYVDLFDFIRYSYLTGTDDIKQTVDVAFVENLFWLISADKARPYWSVLPETLKDLYVKFHRRTPL